MSLVDEVKKVVAEQFGLKVEEITNETEFIKDLNADSLDKLGILMDVEDVLEKNGVKINVPDEDAEKITTVGKMIEYIEEKMRALAER